MTRDLGQMAVIAVVLLIILFPVIKFLIAPVRLAAKLALNALVGFVLLWLVNTFGGLIGFFLPINLITIIIAGFLGIPGVLLLAVVKYFLAS